MTCRFPAIHRRYARVLRSVDCERCVTIGGFKVWGFCWLEAGLAGRFGEFQVTRRGCTAGEGYEYFGTSCYGS